MLSAYIQTYIHGEVNMAKDHIYVGEALKILHNMDYRTFRKYLAKGVFTVIDHDSYGHRLFSQKQMTEIAKQIPKDKKRGLPLLQKFPKKPKV